MQEAIRLAVENVSDGGGPFGCVIVRDGKIVGRGVNRVTASNDPSAHAEVVAIRDACSRLSTFQLDGCTLYCSCEPCPMCLGAIYWARPSLVYYAASRVEAANDGFDDLFIYTELALPVEERSVSMKRLGAESASEPFRAWRSKPDRTLY
jgi:tRNA(Arg) A34 adenosine deaminase TadA